MKMKRLNWKKVCSGVMLVCVLACVSACKEEDEVKSAQELLDEAYAVASDEKNSDWVQALALSERAYKLNNNDPAVRIMYAFALERNGRPEDAIAVMEAGGEADKDSFMAQYTLGRLYSLNGDYARAVVPLKRAYELDPEDGDVMLLLEQAYISAGYGKEAMQLCSALQKKFPKQYAKSIFLYNEVALIHYALLGKNDQSKAYAYFNWIARQAPNSPEIQWNMAVYLDHVHENAGMNLKIGGMTQRQAKQQAKRYYSRYLQLTEGMQGWDAEREFAQKRLNQIR